MIDMASVCRGKAAKSRANQLYHERKKADTTVENAIHAQLGVEIPPELLRRGEVVLRASFALDEHEFGPTLGLWTSPYGFFPPPQYQLNALPRPPWLSKGGLWESRAAVLGAFQYTSVITAATTRYERWTLDPIENVQRRVTGEIARRVAAWVELRECDWDQDDYYEDDGDETDLRELALNWGAKLVYMLLDEWGIRSRGLHEYQEAWDTKNLPWHVMIAQSKALYAAEM